MSGVWKWMWILLSPGVKDAAMPGRVEADDRGLDPRPLEYDLDFLMLLHVMWRVTDPVEDVELNQILMAANQKRATVFLHRGR